MSVSFPNRRMRRLRQTPTLRRLVAETRVSVDDLIAPVFVREISMSPSPSNPPRVMHTQESIRAEVELVGLGIPGVVFFGLPDVKTRLAARRGTLMVLSKLL